MTMKLNDATPEQWDAVSKPQHYNTGGIEAIDYIKQQLGSGFVEYCEGNALEVSSPLALQGTPSAGFT
jgi:hypothetical protein